MSLFLLKFERKILKMKKSIYKNYDELPLFLNAKILAEVLGIAPSSAYELMHEKGIPCTQGWQQITRREIRI